MTDRSDVLESAVPASREQWHSFCKSCPGVTFFHTPMWAGLFERCFPRRFRAAPLLFRFHDDTTALLPLVVKRHLSGVVCITSSMPGGTFGGWLSATPLRQQQEAAIMRRLDNHADLVLRENPYRPLLLPPDKYPLHEDHTRTIDLAAGYDDIWMRSTAGHRNAVRNARRSGVEITEAADTGGWEAYSELYGASIARWRRRRIFTGVKYDRSFLREIERMDPSLRKLWLASVKGKFIAGILCFYWKEHAVVWHGAGLSEYFSYHPNNYLYDRAIAHAAAGGYAWFDCNPSGGLAGVDKFKQYLGAQAMRSRVIVRRSMLTRCIGMLRLRPGGGS
ncbi:MAG: GNAT family N-acetyltransferase [Chitinispirillaceae bacterium]|nr:GNAT family N-acetyltransferase [Chitinispirillaceae bacterium]